MAHRMSWLGPQLMVALALALGGCASPPARDPGSPRATSRTMESLPEPAPGLSGRDGPPAVAVDPMSVPDAIPQVEPIRLGGANKPYAVAGQSYVPTTQDEAIVETGLASWYGRLFHGRRTASGEVYNMNAMTAAHKTMPLPSFARVRNPANGREVIVRVNDRGPFVPGRIIDLSYAAAMKLGVVGLARVEVSRLTSQEIRTMDAARRGAPGATASVPVPGPAGVDAPGLSKPGRAVAEPQAGARSDGEQAAAVAVRDPDVQITPDMPGPAPGTSRALTQAAAGFWLQLGAFARSDGALGFHRQLSQELDWLAPLLAVFADGALHRLQAGPYASREQALSAAERVKAAVRLAPLVIERR